MKSPIAVVLALLGASVLAHKLSVSTNIPIIQKQEVQTSDRQYSPTFHHRPKAHTSLIEEQNDPPADDHLVPAYALLLSEINLDSRGILQNQFVEIEALENIYLPKNKHGDNLVGYRLLIIAAEGLTIVTSLYLRDFIPRVTKNFYTIGTKNTPYVDINLQDNDVPSIQTASNSIFPAMDTNPFAIIIIHTSSPVEHEALELQKPSQNYLSMSIEKDTWRQDIVRRNAIDIVVVGRRAPTTGCSFFDTVFPTNSTHGNFLLRDWESDEVIVQDMSISRCCDDEYAFSPECYKLALMTPGQSNDCFNARRFVLEDNLQILERALGPNVETPVDECKSTSQSFTPEDYNIAGNSVNSLLKQLFHTNTDCLGEPSSGDLRSSVPVSEVQYQSIPDLPKKLQFDEVRFEECKDHFTKPNEIKSSDAIEWLDFVKSSSECRFYCHVCKEFVRLGFRPDIKIRADIVRAKGSFSKSKATNSMQIRNHREHVLHKAAMLLHTDLKTADSDQEKISAIEAQLKREREIFLPTMNLIQLVYVELHTGVSFRAHRQFANLLPELGVNVGKHHRHEKAIADAADLISQRFHFILLESLVQSAKPFSLIVDGTTINNVPFMVAMIQTLEGDKPIVYLYALVVLTNGDVSSSMVEDLIDRIKLDDKIYPGFEIFFKTHCMVLASDSASVMVGRVKSFFTHLQLYLGHAIGLSKCGAHKLGRILVHGLDFVTDNSTNTKYFKTFAHTNNQFYTFYMSRGSKRYMELTQKAIDLDLSPTRIKYFFDIRFAASHYRCMKTLYSQYDALRLDLLERVSDPTFKEEAQKTAFQLHSYISDKSFAVTVAEFVDFLSVFQMMSRKFQTKGGLMIGNVKIVREGYEKLLELSVEPGYHLREFLAKARCPDTCEIGACTLEMYDECPEVYIRTGSLESTIPNSVKLSEVRSQLYDSILQEMKAYFPGKELESFDLFNPRYFKFCPLEHVNGETDCDDIDNCYIESPSVFPNETLQTVTEKFKQICNFYGIPTEHCLSIQHEWKLPLSRMVIDRQVFDHRNDDVAEFWPLILQRQDLRIGPNVRELINKILVTAFTSSDAERLFSFLTRIKSPERFNLKSETMEGLARIQFNGPNVLSKQRLFEFTKEFLKTHVRVDDESAVGGRKSSAEEFPNFLAKSSIF